MSFTSMLVSLPPGTYVIDVDTTIPATMSLFFQDGAMLQVQPGVTLTILGVIQAPERRIFFGTGTVTFGPLCSSVSNLVNPRWFGAVGDGIADDSAAVATTLASVAGSGSKLSLPLASYGTLGWRGLGSSGAVRGVATDSPYAVPAVADFELLCNRNGVMHVDLPAAPTDGQTVYIKDAIGVAFATNITVDGNGKLIAGAGTLTIDANYDSVLLKYDSILGGWTKDRTPGSVGAGGGHVIQAAGVNLPSEANLNFGTGLTATDDIGNTASKVVLANTAVVAGSYSQPKITVDAQGRLTSVARGCDCLADEFAYFQSTIGLPSPRWVVWDFGSYPGVGVKTGSGSYSDWIRDTFSIGTGATAMSTVYTYHGSAFTTAYALIEPTSIAEWGLSFWVRYASTPDANTRCIIGARGQTAAADVNWIALGIDGATSVTNWVFFWGPENALNIINSGVAIGGSLFHNFRIWRKSSLTHFEIDGVEVATAANAWPATLASFINYITNGATAAGQTAYRTWSAAYVARRDT